MAQTVPYEELVHFPGGLGRADPAKGVDAQRQMIDLGVQQIVGALPIAKQLSAGRRAASDEGRVVAVPGPRAEWPRACAWGSDRRSRVGVSAGLRRTALTARSMPVAVLTTPPGLQYRHASSRWENSLDA